MRCQVTEWLLKTVFEQLYYQKIALEGMVLKPNMVIAAKKAKHQAGVEVAEKTVKVLKACVPAAVPGIAFLSGGQSDEEATAHLDAMNRIGGLPWRLTFSYGRALQAAPQKAWAGKSENVAAAQRLHAPRHDEQPRRARAVEAGPGEEGGIGPRQRRLRHRWTLTQRHGGTRIKSTREDTPCPGHAAPAASRWRWRCRRCIGGRTPRATRAGPSPSSSPSPPGPAWIPLVRLYGEKLSRRLGQPVVIDNRPGGAGVVAGEAIAKGPPDGYTLAVATSAVMAIRPTLFKQRPFDPLTDFVPISHYVKSPFVFIVNPALPVRSVPEFIKYAKERPGQLSAPPASAEHRT